MSSERVRTGIVAVLTIAAAIFLTKPAAEHRFVTPSEHATYKIEAEPSYLDKIVDPINILTLALVISTLLLWRSTDSLAGLAEEQGRITNDLFFKDQRPWINARLTLANNVPIFNQDGSITIRFRILAQNVGKSPAFKTDNRWLVHVGFEGAEKAFEGMRDFRGRTGGRTVFPNDDISKEMTEQIAKSQIDESNDAQGHGDPMQFVIISYQYRSAFSDEVLETVRMYSFGIGHDQGRLPLSASKAKGKYVQLRLWKELVA